MVFFFPSGFELPRINYDINGKKHRFVYGNCVEESALSKRVTFPFVCNLAIVKKNWWKHLLLHALFFGGEVKAP